MSGAQLGGLSSLSVPSYIPTVQVQKEPKAWEKALMGILATVATSAASQGVSNAMSRDFAPEGEQATGFDRLLHGPKVDEKLYSQQQAEKSANERLLGQAKLQTGLAELEAQPGAKDVVAKNEADLNRSQRNIDEMRQITAQSKMGRRDQAHADSRETGRQGFELGIEGARQAERAPLNASQTAENTARTGQINTQTKQIQQMLDMIQKGQNSGDQYDPITGALIAPKNAGPINAKQAGVVREANRRASTEKPYPATKMPESVFSPQKVDILGPLNEENPTLMSILRSLIENQ